MADKIKIRRGDFGDLPTLDEGEFGLAQDVGSLYIGSSDGNILLNTVKLGVDGYYIDGYLIPTTDNLHGLGTPSNRWSNISVGPGSIHLISHAVDPAGEKEWVISIDNNGRLVILEDDTITPVFALGDSGGTLFGDGSESNPSITFLTDTDTGLFRESADILRVTTGGVTKLSIGDHVVAENGVVFKSTDGYASQPGFSFKDDTNTGILRSGNDIIGISTAGLQKLSIGDHIVAENGSIFKSSDGYAALPAYTFRNDIDTGLFRAGLGLVGISTIGTTRLSISDHIIAENGSIFKSSDGYAALPAYTFGSDQDTGFYRDTEDIIKLSTGGFDRLSVGDHIVAESSSVFKSSDGYLGQPGYTFNSDSDTGIYRIGADQLGVSVGGTQAMFVDSDGRARFVDGDNLLPAISFISDTNTGIFRPTDDQLSIALGGNEEYTFTASTLSMPNNATISSGDGSATAPAYTFASDADTGFYRDTEDILKLSTGGFDRLSVGNHVVAESSSVFKSSDGYAGQPGYTFNSDSDTGMYLSGTGALSFSTGGSLRWTVDSSGNLDSNSATAEIVNGAGTSTDPAYTFLGELTTGISAASSELYLIAGGTNTAKASSTTFTVNSKLFTLDGSSGSGDSIARIISSDDNDAYVMARSYLAGSSQGSERPLGQLQFAGNIFNITDQETIGASIAGVASEGWTPSTAGTEIRISTVTSGDTTLSEKIRITDTGTIRGPDGTSSVPTFSFLSEGNTGIYRSAASTMMHTVGATNIFSVGSGGLTIQSSKTIENDDGAAATPSYSFSASNTTGMFSPTTNTIGFSIQGAEEVRIDSAGKVGIGITPSYTLDVSGGAGSILRVASDTINAAADVLIVDQDSSIARAALQIQGNAGATECLFVSGGGFTGIGETSPSYPLHVTFSGAGNTDAGINIEATSASLEAGGGASPSFDGGLLRISASGAGDSAGYDFIRCKNTAGDKMVFTGLGRLGIATTSPNARVEIEDGGETASVLLKVTADDATPYGIVVGNDTFSTTDTDGLALSVSNAGISTIDARGTASIMAFEIGGSEKMRITNGGLVGVGITPTYTFETYGDVADQIARFYNDGNATTRRGIRIQCGEDSPASTNFFIDFYDGDGGDAGGIERITTGTPTFRAPSDIRIKEDIKDTKVKGLEIINGLEMKEFRKVLSHVGGKRYENPPLTPIGFIAQQVEEVYPDMVSESNGTKQVADGLLVPVLVKAIQELTERIKNLEDRVENPGREVKNG